MRILNNLVTELLNIAEFPNGTDIEWQFMNPRDGWIFISSTAIIENSEQCSPIGKAEGFAGNIDMGINHEGEH